jgi:hypothetical protein
MSISVIKTALGSSIERIAIDSTWEDPEAIKTSGNKLVQNKSCQILKVYITSFFITVELFVGKVILTPNVVLAKSK